MCSTPLPDRPPSTIGRSVGRSVGRPVGFDIPFPCRYRARRARRTFIPPARPPAISLLIPFFPIPSSADFVDMEACTNSAKLIDTPMPCRRSIVGEPRLSPGTPSPLSPTPLLRGLWCFYFRKYFQHRSIGFML